MGAVEIPEWAYWGAQTQRAVENFDVSPLRIPVPMIRALAIIKKCAAEVNGRLGTVDSSLAGTIAAAATEVYQGRWDDHFPIDVFQTGSGTSWNMNANELIANRANEILGEPRGTRKPVHPNDHVNRGQSSNDVIPTAIHIANRVELEGLLLAVDDLAAALSDKEREFAGLVKLGRTHLQDAVPMTLGQEFSGYRTQIEKAAGRLRNTRANLEELALGGTALGTGLNAHPDFAEAVAALIADEMAIGMINGKTTAVRLIPVPGKGPGDRAVFGGLFGESVIIPVRNQGKSSRFIGFGGRIPAPIHSLRN